MNINIIYPLWNSIIIYIISFYSNTFLGQSYWHGYPGTCPEQIWPSPCWRWISKQGRNSPSHRSCLTSSAHNSALNLFFGSIFFPSDENHRDTLNEVFTTSAKVSPKSCLGNSCQFFQRTLSNTMPSKTSWKSMKFTTLQTGPGLINKKRSSFEEFQ